MWQFVCRVMEYGAVGVLGAVKSLNFFADTKNICNFAARNGALCAVETW